ncbi:hypothetical protein HYW46_02705 [Candidatus Daviesbacteria bacterium]|nr:hypothetical protein [Candidatus Daviesbacteria bacterium]
MKEAEQEKQVAIHEIGHAAVAKSLGGEVCKICIIPEGNALGYTSISFSGFGAEEALIGMMASLCGGFVAEERSGHHDHSGCGSDMLKLDYLANIASRILHDGKSAAEHFKSRAFSIARSVMPSFADLESRALHLQREKILV